MPEITMKGYQCTRCNHTWVPRDEGKPMVCPKCKSPYWDKPRQSDAKKGFSKKDKVRYS